MLVHPVKLLKRARAHGYAVPAFNIYNLETAQAVLAAAEELRSPVILQTSEGALKYAGMDFLAAIAHVGAALSRVPVAFHLDHGKDYALVKEAIESGYYTSVMFDGSSFPFEVNAGKTRAVVKFAHSRGVAVEAELGALLGVEDTVRVAARDGYFTDPNDAREFVKYTGCDTLAVSIGTSHGAYKNFVKAKKITLDLRRLEKIASAVKAPLVLHGASCVSQKMVRKLHKKCALLGDCARLSGAQGIPEEEERAAIRLGIAKINIDTDLRIAWTAAVREALIGDKTAYDPRTILSPARDLMREVAKEKMKLFGSAGKA